MSRYWIGTHGSEASLTQHQSCPEHTQTGEVNNSFVQKPMSMWVRAYPSQRRGCWAPATADPQCAPRWLWAGGGGGWLSYHCSCVSPQRNPGPRCTAPTAPCGLVWLPASLGVLSSKWTKAFEACRRWQGLGSHEYSTTCISKECLHDNVEPPPPPQTHKGTYTQARRHLPPASATAGSGGGQQSGRPCDRTPGYGRPVGSRREGGADRG